MSVQPRILVLVPYFGPWPEWVEFFLTTCRWNRTVDWLFVGDRGAPGRLTPNLRHLPMTLEELSSRAEQRLGVRIALPEAYKVCDLRLAFGSLFEDQLAGYDLFAWSDIDVVYGDLRRHLDPGLLTNDVVTFNEEHLSGHLTFVRNNERGRVLHQALPGFLEKVGHAEYQHLDEPHPSALAGVTVHARESFNTPLSKLIPWRDGRFVFPSEWRWRDGSLTNDLDEGVEFLYLHFMHWKGGAWPRECGNAQWERLERVVQFEPSRAADGFRVDAEGFHPWSEAVNLAAVSLERRSASGDSAREPRSESGPGMEVIDSAGSVGRDAGQGDASRVSVIITTFNHARYLRDAIESVLAQTVQSGEIIVVDDGSADRPREIVDDFDGIRMIEQPNRGLSAARNAGLLAASGGHVIFLDADDRLLPRAIESHLAFALSRPECGFVYGAYYDIDEIGRRLRSPDLRDVGNDPFRALLAGNMIGMHATAMYRRSCLDAIGGFDTNLDACEDIDVFLRMALRFPIACHAERIAEYRRHESNMSRSSVRMLRAALRMLAKHRQSARTRAEWWAAYCVAGESWKRHYVGKWVRDLPQRRVEGAIEPRLAWEALLMSGLAPWTLLRELRRSGN